MLYGGNEYTVFRTANGMVTLEECESAYNRFLEVTKDGLQRWKNEEIKKAKSNRGVTYSAFGRPRRLGFYLFHTDPKKVSFGERSVGSHQVQGTCGDVMRIVLSKFYHEYVTKYPNDVQFIGTVHDEIDFILSKDSCTELSNSIMDMMKIEVPGCSIDLDVEIDFGYSYGYKFPFVYNRDEKMWSPKKE
jgi:DNA polymerase I-like protein with 3'-5' exonuclease and polymerase domains